MSEISINKKDRIISQVENFLSSRLREKDQQGNKDRPGSFWQL